MAASGGATSVDSTISQVKRLTNANLKVVCKYANLPVSGAKAALQSRVIDRECSHVNLYACYSTRARSSLCCQLRQSGRAPHSQERNQSATHVLRPVSERPAAQQYSRYNTEPDWPTQSLPCIVNAFTEFLWIWRQQTFKWSRYTYVRPKAAPILEGPEDLHFLGGPLFKESPFFKILEPLTPLIECQGQCSRIPGQVVRGCSINPSE